MPILFWQWDKDENFNKLIIAKKARIISSSIVNNQKKNSIICLITSMFYCAKVMKFTTEKRWMDFMWNMFIKYMLSKIFPSSCSTLLEWIKKEINKINHTYFEFWTKTKNLTVYLKNLSCLRCGCIIHIYIFTYKINTFMNQKLMIKHFKSWLGKKSMWRKTFKILCAC